MTRTVAAHCLALALACLPAAAGAECFADAAGGDGALGALIERDPAAAIVQLQALLPQAGNGDPAVPSRAHVYAMLMEAWFERGDVQRAFDAASRGIDSLSAADGVGLRRRLEFRRAALLNLTGQLRHAAQDVELEAPAVPDDAPEKTCVLEERGYLRLRLGQVPLAASDLIRAASLARARHDETDRFIATGVLSMLYARDGFYTEAMALADEAVANYQESGDNRGLGDAYFRRGDVYFEEGDYGSAEPDFAEALRLAQRGGGQIDVYAAEQRLCRVRARIGTDPGAGRFCEDVLAHLRLKDSESARLIQAALGEIELAAGHVARAVQLFDAALAQGGAEMSMHSQVEIRAERGRALTALGQWRAALQDMSAVASWAEQERKAGVIERVSLWRVKSALEDKEDQLERARAAGESARRDASRQALLRNVIAVAATLVIVAVALVAWLIRRRTAIDAARRMAESRLAAVGKLTAGVAHEFNNNLTVIQQAAGLLRQRVEAAGDGVSCTLVAEIDRSSRSSAEVTAQLLSFARQQHLNPCALSLGPYLAETLPTLQKMAGDAVRVEVDMPEPVRAAWADPRQLTAALLNLVANGRDSMPGGGKVVVRVSASGADQVRIDVADQGGGMPQDVLARATEPFFTTKNVGHGSGLGLSMVDGFVTQSGGRLLLHSELGVGTTVTLLLPVAA